MKYKVLIVDDDERMANVLAILFKTKQFEVDVATNYDNGKEKIQNGQYDVLILDYRLDQKDGLQLYQEVKNNVSKDTLVVIISALDDIEMLKEVANEGIYFVRKGDIKYFCFTSLVKTLNMLRRVNDDRD